MSAVKVTADRESCISAGRCLATAPNVFDQDDEGLVLVIESEPGEADRKLVAEAVYQCPAKAIQLSDSEAG